MRLDEGTIEELAPREITAQSRVETHIFRVIECDRPLAGGSRHSLHGIDRVTIGRGPELGVHRSVSEGEHLLDLRVPGRFMSTAHAILVRRDRGWSIEDAGSKNGTCLNGVRLTQRAEINDGDVFELGHTFFTFRRSMTTPLDVPPDVFSPEDRAEPVGLRTNLPGIAARHEALKKVARSKLPLLLLGPTGTGKEVLARAIHALSGRTGPMVGVNCGALPPTLVESLLFGHVKGAFSGAVNHEVGFMRAADGGTLLLDEIGDLPLASQVALLRVLEEGEIVPLGATRPIAVDVRVIAATHRPIDQLAGRGEFRSDLLGRLKGYAHPLTPLRDRREDLGIILADMLTEIAEESPSPVRFSPDVIRLFLSHPWPLNVRELHQVMRASLLLAKDGYIEREHLPADLLEAPDPMALETPIPRERAGSVRGIPPGDGEELRKALEERLEMERGNVAAVARTMGKAPFQIHRWMKRFGIDPNTFR